MFDCFRMLSSEFQAIPVDVWAELVFMRPQADRIALPRGY